MAELTQWEYYVLESQNQTPEMLNKLGAQGWELVLRKDTAYKDQLLFKRPKIQQSYTTPQNYGYGY